MGTSLYLAAVKLPLLRIAGTQVLHPKLGTKGVNHQRIITQL